MNYRNKVLHSHTTQFARDENDSGLSIKYVVKGVERYRIGQQWHHVTDGKFLLVNEHQTFQCRVESPQVVEGLCIYVEPARVYEAFRCMTTGHDRLLDEGGRTPAPQVYFVEKIYGLQENRVGDFLAKMVGTLRDPAQREALDADLFFQMLAEQLALTQVEVDLLLGRLAYERPATRQEIFRRVSFARQFIDAHFLQDICLDDLASAAHFSKYHFLRCFKQVYGLSPYQYVLQRRLEEARQRLRANRHSLTEIALETGFGDRRAFNKAFRKAYGLNPGDYRGMA